jgi:hypothetical protein
MENTIADITPKSIKKPKQVLWILFSTLFGMILYILFLKEYIGISTTIFIGLIIMMIASLISLRYDDFKIIYDHGDIKGRKGEKLKTTLWISWAALLGITLLITPFFDSPIPYYVLFLELCCLILLSVIVLKYYDLPLIGFLIVLFGLYTKRLHWPFAGQDMGLGTGILIVFSLYNSGRFIITFSSKEFLKWFGSIAGIIITLFMTGMLVMFMYWPGRVFFISSGCFLFILYVLALVFKLPDSNYLAWSEMERKVFYRAVMIPLIFIFALIILIVVFPETYNTIMGRIGTSGYVPHFNYESNTIKLFNLEGLLPY